MIIYVAINTEANIVSAWTEDSSDYSVEWHGVEFDNMDLQEIVQDAKEEISKNS